MTNERKNFKAHIAVLLTNIFFAANYSLVKLISPELVGPFALNVLRVGISAILFWAVMLIGKTSPLIERRDRGRFALCGLTGIAINQMLFIKGLTLTSTIHATLLMLVTPIVVSLFALWVLKEQFTLFKAMGLALGIGGAVFLILQREAAQHAANYLLGDLLIVINAVSYSVYFILVKPLMQRYSAMHVMCWVFTIGFFIILPVGFIQATEIEWNSFLPHHFAAFSFVALLGTFLAYYFNAYGIAKLGASVTGSYIYTQPVFAVVIAIFLLGERVTWQKSVAAVLIFAGVFLVNLRKRDS